MRIIQHFGLLALSFILIPANVAAQGCLTPNNEKKICMSVPDKNVIGEDLNACGYDPVTGFYRNGYCQTGIEDRGIHVVCAIVTQEFLEYSRTKGNDLISPRPEFNFPGLKDGDRWCLCAARWYQAYKADVAPPVLLSATHEKGGEIIPIEILKKFAKDL